MTRSKKIRLDQLLLERELFSSRSRAQAAILAGNVSVDGRRDVKAGDRVSPDASIEVLEGECPYVSRGGTKMEAALDAFGIDPAGWTVLDIGASTGGFTDCLLKRGAARVTALDVGKGLIAWSLRTDPRVEVIENTNARTLTPDRVPGPFDMIVIDVSFISLKLIFPLLPSRMKPDGTLLALIKPQFEAGKGAAPGGVVRDRGIWRDVLRSFTSSEIFKSSHAPTASQLPELIELIASPIPGREGNREFFGCWRLGGKPFIQEDLANSIDKIVS